MTKGQMMLASSLATPYVMDPPTGNSELEGVPILWILGRP